jgi:hypothetical protein
MLLDHDDRYQLMKEEEADARDLRASQLAVAAALVSCSEWQADTIIAEHRLDAATADAMRMLLYLGAARAQFRWIERQLFSPRVMNRACTPYERTLIRFWLTIWDNEQRSQRHG